MKSAAKPSPSPSSSSRREPSATAKATGARSKPPRDTKDVFRKPLPPKSLRLGVPAGKFQRKAISLEKLSSRAKTLSKSQDNFGSMATKPRPAQSALGLNRAREEKLPSTTMNGKDSKPPSANTSPQKQKLNGMAVVKVISNSRPRPVAPPPPVIRNAIRKVTPESGRNGPFDEPDDVVKEQSAPEFVKPSTAISTVLKVTTKERVEKELASKQLKSKKVEKDAQDAQLDSLLREKQNLEVRVQELVNSAENKTAEIATLKMEINRLKALELTGDDHEDVRESIDTLSAENRMLKEKLVEMGVRLDSGAISDAEKELLLRQKCFSAPPSVFGLDSFLQSNLDRECSSEYGDMIVPGRLPGQCGGGCSTANAGGHGMSMGNNGSCEWDKQSASSLSEMSVACLQDRIMQMEENHYSTNEELQATLQELSDLQDQLTDLQVEVETLNNEKRVIFDSLYSQTEKLEDCRQQNNNMKQLLFTKAQDANFCQSDREQRLLDLLRAAQEEKELLLLKQEDLQAQVALARDAQHEAQRETALLRDRLKLVETTVESQQMERRRFEKQAVDLREQVNREKCEVTRLSSLVEASKMRIAELEDALAVSRRCPSGDCRLSPQEAPLPIEVQDLLETARAERDKAEAQASRLEEQIVGTNRELARLREHIVSLQDEAINAKKEARKELGDVEFKLEQVMKEKQAMAEEIRLLRERFSEAELTAQRHLEDKRDLKASLSDAQRRLQEAAQEISETRKRQHRIDERHRVETEEWEQFQQDLLMTVRVANDFKAEAQSNLEKLLHENRTLRDKIRSLELEIDRIKSEKSAVVSASPLQSLRPVGSPLTSLDSHHLHHLAGLDRDIGVRRSGTGAAVPGTSRPFALSSGRSSGEHRHSVRSLISSIESATKHAKANPPTSALTGLEKPTSVPPSPTNSSSGLSSSSSTNTPTSNISSRPTTPPATPPPSTPSEFLVHHSHRNSPVSAVAPTFRPSPSSSPSRKVSFSDSPTTTPVGVSSPVSSPNAKTGILSTKSKLTTESRTSTSSTEVSSGVLKHRPYHHHPLLVVGDAGVTTDPLAELAKRYGGSKRNALLKWCVQKTMGYHGIDITNFSSSWNDGLAFCSLLHTYMPDKIGDYDALIKGNNKRRNFMAAFRAAESVGIETTLDVNEMVSYERPDWNAVMSYVTSIYKHFET